MMGTAAETISL